MKLQEWILDGTATNGDATKPITLHTTTSASRVIAYQKMCCTIPEHSRFCVRLRKGKIIEKPEPTTHNDRDISREEFDAAIKRTGNRFPLVGWCPLD